MKIGLKSWVTVVCNSIDGKSTVAYSVWPRRGGGMTFGLSYQEVIKMRVWEVRTPL